MVFNDELWLVRKGEWQWDKPPLVAGWRADRLCRQNLLHVQ